MPLRLHHLRGRSGPGKYQGLSLHRLPAAYGHRVSHVRSGCRSLVSLGRRADDLCQDGGEWTQTPVGILSSVWLTNLWNSCWRWTKGLFHPGRNRAPARTADPEVSNLDTLATALGAPSRFG